MFFANTPFIEIGLVLDKILDPPFHLLEKYFWISVFDEVLKSCPYYWPDKSDVGYDLAIGRIINFIAGHSHPVR